MFGKTHEMFPRKKAAPPPPRDEFTEWKRRTDVFEQSYKEVLNALKHQDDKLGRALTAQAFLTAAGITIFTQLGVHQILTFDGQPLRATRFFFVSFVVSIALALAFTLSAIGPSTPYRRSRGPGVRGSLLFYASIRLDKEWADRIEKTESIPLQEMLARDFHEEAEKLSHRVHYKVTRAREAAAFVILALASLAVLGTFSLTGIGPATRWWIASGILLLFAMLPLWDIFHMQTLSFPEGNADWTSYSLLFVSIALGGVLLGVAPSQETHWLAISYMLGLILASRLGFVSRSFARTLFAIITVAGVTMLIVVAALL